jgi:stage V sporulation protein B
MTASRATELFGQLTGMAGSLINLPTIITISLAVSLVPAVSEAVAKRRRPQAISRIAASLRITILLCLPAAAGLAVLAKPISVLLYDVAEVGIPLAYLAPGILFLGLYQTTSGALQGLSKTFIPVTNLLIGLVLKSFLNYYLTAIPGVDVRGAAIATVSAFFLAFLLNFFALRQLIGLKLAAMDSLFLPGLATGLMAVAIKHLYQFSLGFVPGSFATLAAVFAGIFIFFFSLLMLGGLTVEDVAMVPGVGKKVASFLQKIRLLR